MELKLYKPQKGRKSFVGVLSGYEDGTVTITVGDEVLPFTAAETAQVHLHVSF